MNNLNNPNDLVNIRFIKTDDEPVEYFPGLFCCVTRPSVSVTDDGRNFLRDISEKYTKRTMNEQQVVYLLNSLAEEIDSSLQWEITDALFTELYKMI